MSKILMLSVRETLVAMLESENYQLELAEDGFKVCRIHSTNSLPNIYGGINGLD